MKTGNKTKIRYILLSIVLAVSVLPVGIAAVHFEDIEDFWAGEDITVLHERGVYEGMIFDAPEYFQPNQPVTRAEFLLMLFNAMGLDLKARDTALSAQFADYNEIPEVYQPYLIEGYNRGVMLGRIGEDGESYSGWDAPIHRQEAVTVIGRILNARSADELGFTDGDEVDVWAREYVAALTGKGIVSGMPDGTFLPRETMTRAEASHIVYLLMEQRLFVQAEIRVYAGSTALGIADGVRLEASFAVPYGIAIDGDNSLLVADKEANLLRRISADAVSTVAGQTEETDINDLPSGGYTDSVSAQDVKMRGPRYVCTTPDGTIYYTDGGNNVVRMITVDGKGYTLSGNGKQGYVNGTREKSEFSLPSGIAISADGVIYIADTLNNCIRTITPSGQSALYAGGIGGGYKDGALTEALFCQPTDIQFGADGALYIADTGNSMIRVIRDGQVTTLAGKATERDELSDAMEGGYHDGAAADALFCGPKGLFVTSGGVVFVADTDNNVVRKIEAGYVTTVAGNLRAGNSTGPALVSMLSAPVDVVVLGGRVYVSDGNNHCIKVFGTDLEG